MNKIKIFALGGLNENGKNMYVVNINEDIFIFDAGLKYASDVLLGVDYVIPDFKYLKENRSKIKGIFLTHGHDENMGAIPSIIKEIPDIKIYGTKFTLDVLKREIENNEKNLIEIKAHKKIDFGKTSIFPINVTHSIPDAVMYVINNIDGAIVYTGDFTFDSEASGAYKTDIGKIAYVGKQGVLCLLSQSLYSEKRGHTSPKHRTSSLIRETLKKNKGRLIFNVTSTEVSRIQELFDELSKTDRKIVIMGKRSEKIITDAINNKYMHLNKNKIGDLSNLNDKNVVILISDEKASPYVNLSRIVSGNDKFVKIKETDTVLFADPTKEGLERLPNTLGNEIAKLGANVIELSPKKHLEYNASQEDLTLMFNLLNPKYYMPVIGDYRFQYQNAELATKAGMNKDHVLLKLNGEVVEFNDGKLIDKKEKIKIEDILIDGTIGNDIGEIVIRDREMLSDNGIFIVATTIDKTNKKILSGPTVLTRGFVYVKENTELIKEAERLSLEAIKKNINNNRVDYTNIKSDVREKLSKYLYAKTKCRPMILTVIQEI